jgi:hypothetical protein
VRENIDNIEQAAKAIIVALEKFGKEMLPIFQRAADQIAQNKGYKDAAHMLAEIEEGDEEENNIPDEFEQLSLFKNIN